MIASVKLSRDQLASRKERAVRFVRDVLDDDRAEEIESESLDDYAARRRIQLLNPKKGNLMAQRTKSRQELQQRIRELEEENEQLQDQVDQVADIVAPVEDEGEEEEEETE